MSATAEPIRRCRNCGDQIIQGGIPLVPWYHAASRMSECEIGTIDGSYEDHVRAGLNHDRREVERRRAAMR